MCDLKKSLLILVLIYVCKNEIALSKPGSDTSFYFLNKKYKEIKVERKSQCHVYKIATRDDSRGIFNLKIYTSYDSLLSDQTYEFTYPKFNGDVNKYLAENVQYPFKGIKWGKEGKVIVKFKVTELGKVTDVKITRSAGRLFDKEAIRVVKNMPDWIPGTFDHKPTANYFSLPVTFKLED